MNFMMEYNGMLLHNVQELIYDREHRDYGLNRVPESLRVRLNPKAQKTFGLSAAVSFGL